jgi:hypothetical protein
MASRVRDVAEDEQATPDRVARAKTAPARRAHADRIRGSARCTRS